MRQKVAYRSLKPMENHQTVSPRKLAYAQMTTRVTDSARRERHEKREVVVAYERF